MVTPDEVRHIRRRVVTDGLAISFSAAAFTIVHGLAARQAGFSFVEAMAMSAIRSLGRLDLGTDAVAAAMPVIPWVVATAVGHPGGELMPDLRVLGMDVVFPAAMAGLAVALVTDSRSLVAAATEAVLAS